MLTRAINLGTRALARRRADGSQTRTYDSSFAGGQDPPLALIATHLSAYYQYIQPGGLRGAKR